MNIAQAAGMAAAMCIEINSQPRDLPVRALQQALLNDVQAPAAIVYVVQFTTKTPRLAHKAAVLFRQLS